MNNVVHRPKSIRKPFAVAIAAAATVGLLAGCSSSGASKPTPIPTVKGAASKVSAPILDTLSGAEKSRVANLILQARTEGALNWDDSVLANTSEASVISAFEKAYNIPNINVTYNRQMSGVIATQVQQEVTAGKITTDVVGTASPSFFQTLEAAHALTKYTSPNASAYAASAKYVDDEPGYWISPFAYAFEPISAPSHYSPSLTSWQNLLAPALKGHISMPDPRSSTAGLYNYIALRKILPLSFFKSLAKQDPILSTGGSIQDTQEITSGQVLTSITSGFRALQTVAQTGVPITVSYPKQGVIMIGQSYGILADSPDPAMAELFEDFILSKPGLQTIVNDEGVTPARSGITVSANVKKYAPASLTAVKVIPMDYEKITQAQLSAALLEWQSVFAQ